LQIVETVSSIPVSGMASEPASPTRYKDVLIPRYSFNCSVYPFTILLSCTGLVVHQVSASFTSPRRAGFLIAGLASLTPVD
jgi:hypothetical protein